MFRRWLFRPLLERIITMSQAQLDAIAAIKAQLLKAKGEIVAKVQALEDALNNANVDDPAVTAALADLKGESQALDDLNTDAIPGDTGGATDANPTA